MALARRYINRAKMLEDAETVLKWARLHPNSLKAGEPGKSEALEFLDEFEGGLHAILDDDDDDREHMSIEDDEEDDSEEDTDE